MSITYNISGTNESGLRVYVTALHGDCSTDRHKACTFTADTLCDLARDVGYYRDVCRLTDVGAFNFGEA